jgi:hypothetical protein
MKLQRYNTERERGAGGEERTSQNGTAPQTQRVNLPSSSAGSVSVFSFACVLGLMRSSDKDPRRKRTSRSSRSCFFGTVKIVKRPCSYKPTRSSPALFLFEYASHHRPAGRADRTVAPQLDPRSETPLQTNVRDLRRCPSR